LRIGDRRKVIVVDNKLLLIEKNKNVCTLTLNRPEKKNSLTPDLVEILLDTFEELAGDDTVRTVVIRGIGNQAFCSGYVISGPCLLAYPMMWARN
jgi:enoyl-CoA hydratase/carnithine racemase